jgi:HEAT repeat protein
MGRCRLAVLLGTLGAALVFSADVRPQAQDGPLAVEINLLREQNVGTDGPELLRFFEARSLREADRQKLDELVAQLDDPSFRKRQEASEKLAAWGSVALPFLKKALVNPSLEMKRRAEVCISKIERGPGPMLPVAAARVLAQRNPPGAIEALFNYVPFAEDEWVEEEVLISLAGLGVRQDRVDPLLQTALKDARPWRRAAGAYVLGRAGPAEYRGAVRELLSDTDALVRKRAAAGLIGKQVFQSHADVLSADQSLLKDAGVATEPPALLQFVRRRTLDDEARCDLERLIRQLGDSSYRKREEASRKLMAMPTSILPFLETASHDSDLEISHRAARCYELLRRGPGTAQSLAAVRLLASQAAPAEAVPMLLRFVPFAEDESVEEEVLNALSLLSVREAKVDPSLSAGLADPLAGRRAAAAYVLGKVGNREQCDQIRPLLRDEVSKVRFRAALGLLAARDRSAVPVLISLLGEPQAPWAWQVEETLRRLAADRAPQPPDTADAKARQKVVAAWSSWWDEQGSAINLAHLTQGEANLGLTTIVEYDNFVGGGQGQVWECGRDGKARWKITGLMGPMDAQVLPGGRVLIAENSGQRVTERDLKGNVKWSYSIPGGNPIACQRLPNGNTFIATYNQVMEVTRDLKPVYTAQHGPAFYLFGCTRMRNGHTVCMTAQGKVMELDGAGKPIREVQLQHNGWCGVESLPSGRYLVALMSNNTVQEIDQTGKSHWSVTFPGVFRAHRSPSGNTLVASMTTRKVAELDRGGRVVWERTCDGRPWMIRAR